MSSGCATNYHNIAGRTTHPSLPTVAFIISPCICGLIHHSVLLVYYCLLKVFIPGSGELSPTFFLDALTTMVFVIL